MSLCLCSLEKIDNVCGLVPSTYRADIHERASEVEEAFADRARAQTLTDQLFLSQNTSNCAPFADFCGVVRRVCEQNDSDPQYVDVLRSVLADRAEMEPLQAAHVLVLMLSRGLLQDLCENEKVAVVAAYVGLKHAQRNCVFRTRPLRSQNIQKYLSLETCVVTDGVVPLTETAATQAVCRAFCELREYEGRPVFSHI